MRVNVTPSELAALLPTNDRAATGAASADASFAASLAKLSSVSTPASGGARAATEATQKTSAQPTDSKSAKPRNETYQPVEGERYEEIVSGPRNGMFINRSGNARDGKAFVLVKHADHELHIYGSGRNRLVVRVVPPELRAETDAAPPVPKTRAADTPSTTPVAGAPTRPPRSPASRRVTA